MRGSSGAKEAGQRDWSSLYGQGSRQLLSEVYLNWRTVSSCSSSAGAQKTACWSACCWRIAPSFTVLEDRPIIHAAGGSPHHSRCWRIAPSFTLLEDRPIINAAGGSPHHSRCWKIAPSFTLLEDRPIINAAGGSPHHSRCWRIAPSFTLLEDRPTIHAAGGSPHHSRCLRIAPHSRCWRIARSPLHTDLQATEFGGICKAGDCVLKTVC
ncbi:hypothetical protein ACOMHN_041572 [Nucella lapillus]